MSKTKSTKKQTTNHKAGKLGDIHGFSVVSVLRKLGATGVSTAWAKDILKAKGLKVSPITVSIQIGKGKAGDGKVAELTKDQLTELKALAPEPIEEPKEAKKK